MTLREFIHTLKQHVESSEEGLTLSKKDIKELLKQFSDFGVLDNRGPKLRALSVGEKKPPDDIYITRRRGIITRLSLIRVVGDMAEISCGGSIPVYMPLEVILEDYTLFPFQILFDSPFSKPIADAVIDLDKDVIWG